MEEYHLYPDDDVFLKEMGKLILEDCFLDLSLNINGNIFKVHGVIMFIFSRHIRGLILSGAARDNKLIWFMSQLGCNDLS